ncbi:MAG: bifunctional nuclease family protein [Nitrospirales bacterium]|nr:bifunctional nuclease family protein [Nitrospira sp.]MDR4500140.1 bifunctional nuclease family protein [Nitrospirales bacterium]
MRGYVVASCVFLWFWSGLIVSSYAQESSLESEEVVIEKVEVHVSSHGPVVLLEVGQQAIPIYVDPTVAGSIQGALSGFMFPRPLSHDLMHTILEAYSVKVDRVFISLKDGIYYGTMTLSLNGHTKIFDSRSSDAIALAIHFHTPIVVSRELLESAGKPIPGKEQEKIQL